VSDVVLGIALAALAQVEIWASPRSARAQWELAAVAGTAALVLVWRRSRPLAATLTCLAAIAAVAAIGPPTDSWFAAYIMLSMYSVGRHAPTRDALWALTMCLVVDLLIIDQQDNEGASLLATVGNYAFAAVLITGMPWTAGFAVRRRALEGVRGAAAAVGAERVRIARELHDVVGHALGVIVVQAGAERATLPPGAPESSRETLATIEETARQALTEMRRLLAVMRRVDAIGVSRDPQPSLDQIGSLLRTVEAAGLHTELHIEGEPVALSPGVDLSAYRIVQEALTNALRYSGPARTKVTIRYTAGHLELEVVDDGPGVSKVMSAGYGLAGMGERVALYGGSLTVGNRPEGGFAVRVRLPYQLSDK